jgi:hypothetical protein
VRHPWPARNISERPPRISWPARREEPLVEQRGNRVAILRLEVAGRPQELAEPAPPDQGDVDDAAAAEPGQFGAHEAQSPADGHVCLHLQELGPHGSDLVEQTADE